ncbi:MAG: DUF4864 domain-containing protein [Alphaproteobacteria bacterium]|nr:DUF4864 domain-containing protein [Alphaproteobacteria bacterium]
MRVRVFAALLVFLLSSLPVVAEDARRAGILSVIGAQLDAFQRDDAAAAFAIASPDIQAMFGSPENFLCMVAASYAPVYRPRAVTYLDLVERDQQLVQRVLFTGPDGGQVVGLYMMARQSDGSWRIAGCVLVRPNGGSA